MRSAATFNMRITVVVSGFVTAQRAKAMAEAKHPKNWKELGHANPMRDIFVEKLVRLRYNIGCFRRFLRNVLTWFLGLQPSSCHDRRFSTSQWVKVVIGSHAPPRCLSSSPVARPLFFQRVSLLFSLATRLADLFAVQPSSTALEHPATVGCSHHFTSF